MYKKGKCIAKRAFNWKSIGKFCNDSFCISYQKQKKRNSKAISSKFLKVTRINTCDRELRNCDTISYPGHYYHHYIKLLNQHTWARVRNQVGARLKHFLGEIF